MSRLRRAVLPLASVALLGAAWAAAPEDPDARRDAFRQLEDLLPTPNAYRTASGAPGHDYWQQRADYSIRVRLDEAERAIEGQERITYHNESPDALEYLWLQIDPNIFAPESHAVTTSLAPGLDNASFRTLERELERDAFDGSARITRVSGPDGGELHHVVVGTMMRVDLPAPLASGASFGFDVDWNYRINDASVRRGRTGFEHFEEDDNCIFEIAQWFPRMAAYTDVTGWQHKQYLGSGEFTLEFGDYEVEITVPDDHVVAATGVLQNPDEVLTSEQRARLQDARSADLPVFVVTPEEAKENQAEKAEGEATWVFRAENVRDFAFASSRKFIWDALLHPVEGGAPVLAMSYYPNEAEPLWSRYSTQAIVHTLDVYSAHAFPYPYPVASSVNGPVGGMEYPMICFNGPRPEDDGTYSERTKYGLISVVIHEVGHNWFPMVVNSDERQWTWMDEGLNTFLQYLAEQAWEDAYPSSRGEPKDIVGYMKSEEQVPIMTNSDSVIQFGSNAYAKPATALNVLRETVMGRDLFDFSFRQYARRWMFKRPMPADLFRTLEDASAVDLDWFWRGWFFGTSCVDVSIASVTHYEIATQDPDVEKPLAREKREAEPVTLAAARNASMPKRVDAVPSLRDFYNDYDELDVTEEDRKAYRDLLEKLDDEQEALLAKGLQLYVVELENLGGLVTPVVLEVHRAGGEVEEVRIPVEVWRRDSGRISKLLVGQRPIERIVLDPHLETADVDLSNNVFPPEPIAGGRLELRDSPWGRRGGGGRNPMQRVQEAQARAEKEAAESAAGAERPGEGDGRGARGAGPDRGDG